MNAKFAVAMVVESLVGFACLDLRGVLILREFREMEMMAQAS